VLGFTRSTRAGLNVKDIRRGQDTSRRWRTRVFSREVEETGCGWNGLFEGGLADKMGKL